MPEARTILRLAKTAIVSLFETHARWVAPVSHLSDRNHSALVDLEWRRRTLIVRGQSNSTALTIAFDGRTGINVKDAFDISLRRPDRQSGATVSLMSDVRYFPAPRYARVFLALAAAIPHVALALFQSFKDIVVFLRTKDAATAMRLRKKFGIIPGDEAVCTMPCDLLSRSGTSVDNSLSATIVVPVFNAFDELSSLLSRLKPSQCPILFIDDASDDIRIAPLLADFVAQTPNAKLISHQINQGFVATANTGFAHTDGHIILLNSDTIPPCDDWVKRLLRPFSQDPKVASVTPFSNNAEILSIPTAQVTSVVDATLVDYVNYTAKSINARYTTCEIPTGIGFCMALNKDFLARIGPFDPAFGQGYGEEVDWCQKARKTGGRNVALASVFVGHKGGASFGPEKKKRIDNASNMINARYPTYDADVQNWIADAPVQAQKIALSVAWLSALATSPTPVFIAHSMGGGAEAALQVSITTALKNHPGIVVLRVGGPSLWRLELIGTDFHLRCDTPTTQSVADLLEPLDRIQLVYSCGVGGRHPLDAVELMQQIYDERCTLEISIHDFFPVSPSWNLLDAAGHFHGIPDLCTKDTAHALPALHGRAPVSHSEWRALWANLFSHAQRVTVFSQSSADLIKEAYPIVASKIGIKPHDLTNLPTPVSCGGQVVGILGSLNRAKGAGVMQRLSEMHASTRRFIVLGEMDGAFSLKRPSLVHGRYAQNEISLLARKYDIGAWLIPSICPETFSFATHESLATGLPVLAFARGAQGEAVQGATNGHVIHADPSDTEAVMAAIESAFVNTKQGSDGTVSAL